VDWVEMSVVAWWVELVTRRCPKHYRRTHKQAPNHHAEQCCSHLSFVGNIIFDKLIHQPSKKTSICSVGCELGEQLVKPSGFRFLYARLVTSIPQQSDYQSHNASAWLWKGLTEREANGLA
jgi:hypothetical protein